MITPTFRGVFHFPIKVEVTGNTKDHLGINEEHVFRTRKTTGKESRQIFVANQIRRDRGETNGKELTHNNEIMIPKGTNVHSIVTVSTEYEWECEWFGRFPKPLDKLLKVKEEVSHILDPKKLPAPPKPTDDPLKTQEDWKKEPADFARKKLIFAAEHRRKYAKKSGKTSLDIGKLVLYAAPRGNSVVRRKLGRSEVHAEVSGTTTHPVQRAFKSAHLTMNSLCLDARAPRLSTVTAGCRLESWRYTSARAARMPSRRLYVPYTLPPPTRLYDNARRGPACDVTRGPLYRSDYSTPSQKDRVRFPTGLLPDFRKWESSRTMPLVGGCPQGSPCLEPPKSLHSTPLLSIKYVRGLASSETDLLTNFQYDKRTVNLPRRGANPRPSDYKSATLP
ncbi:hypothetical protein PR048_000482 [Dryococelus australis]|uniref:Uncharacterized protein n=1 Tax=Dryococelus australis TaxID=614101 RepID=A0ABQ9IER0_9NEOP|nr:hypothetical protein PR048_000482 [Dryococelus australis]